MTHSSDPQGLTAAPTPSRSPAAPPAATSRCRRRRRGHPFDLGGADLVEVAPGLGGPGNITAIAAATLAFDLVHLLASGRRR